jgi:hypothetical protein
MILFSIKIRTFFVRSKEESICPFCGGTLTVKDSRDRCCIDDAGCRHTLRIRRLRCKNCHKIHSELPDIIQPFKHYTSSVIETVLDGDESTCPAEISTMHRWTSWFSSSAKQIEGALRSLHIYFNQKPINLLTNTSLLLKIQESGPGWLKIIMRQLTNSGNFIHTCFAFCP